MSNILDQLKALAAAREKAQKPYRVYNNYGDAIMEDDDAVFYDSAYAIDYPRLIAMVERYEAALRFYAYADCRPPIPDDEPMRDSGKRAREALAKETP